MRAIENVYKYNSVEKVYKRRRKRPNYSYDIYKLLSKFSFTFRNIHQIFSSQENENNIIEILNNVRVKEPCRF